MFCNPGNFFPLHYLLILYLGQFFTVQRPFRPKSVKGVSFERRGGYLDPCEFEYERKEGSREGAECKDEGYENDANGGRDYKCVSAAERKRMRNRWCLLINVNSRATLQFPFENSIEFMPNIPVPKESGNLFCQPVVQAGTRYWDLRR